MGKSESSSKLAPYNDRNVPIVARLLVAFLVVSILPIGILAYLSFRESQQPEGHVEANCPPAETHAGAEEEGEGCPHAGESIGGVSIAMVELGVAGASLLLSIVMALYIGRTLVRPLKGLEASMSMVEGGDLQVKADVARNDEIGHLARAFNRMVEGLQRERLVRDLFGQYVTPEVANLAIERRGHLDGELVMGTVLFADIRNFTGISEALPPRQLIEMLNDYFRRMSAVVVEQGGLVNKFGGDSLLAVFGTPLNPATDHTARAVRAALVMQRTLEEFNVGQREKKLPEIEIGIGIATGELVAGNVGSDKKIEYTVIGDTVNLASRLQALTKELRHPILVTAEAASGAGGEALFEAVGDVQVRGKTNPVGVFAVAATESASRSV